MKSVEKTIEKDFSLFFRDPIDELNKLNKEETHTQNKKKQVVIDIAKRLELEVPIDTICMIIIKNLRGVLKPRTIREYLPDKYKSSHRSMNAKKQKNEQPESIPIDNLAAVPPLNQEEVDEIDTIVIDTKDKISIDKEEASIQPFSPVDISMIDTDLVRSTENHPSINSETESLQQVRPDNIGQNKCPECLKKDVKILELTEIIDKLEKFVPADKLVDNKEVPYEFDIPFEELRKKMQEIFSSLGDKVKVRFKGVVVSTTGETILLFYGSSIS